MKTLYYSTKLDKNKNKLTVGYVTERNRERYSKDGAYDDTLIYADFNDEGKLALLDKRRHHLAGELMRGMLVNNNYEPSESVTDGPFVLYGKLNDKWSRTSFTFRDFSTANSSMKSMISQYQAMLIREESRDVLVPANGPVYDDDLVIGE